MQRKTFRYSNCTSKSCRGEKNEDEGMFEGEAYDLPICEPNSQLEGRRLTV